MKKGWDTNGWWSLPSSAFTVHMPPLWHGHWAYDTGVKCTHTVPAKQSSCTNMTFTSRGRLLTLWFIVWLVTVGIPLVVVWWLRSDVVVFSCGHVFEAFFGYNHINVVIASSHKFWNILMSVISQMTWNARTARECVCLMGAMTSRWWQGAVGRTHVTRLSFTIHTIHIIL